ncbi:integrase [Mycobacterium paragordonae]|uniref:Integrase n=1 Tax=Mycobacterium paragordonae TaxID=1389713 RepID=A0ABQ1CG20_9MYCO|nr:integrase [Mycobacterium paragordonae]
MACLVVSRGGRLVATEDPGEPFQLVDASGVVVEPVSMFLRELLAAGRSPATLRSYGMDLLRWWRFLDAVDVGWRRATRTEARDFSCWIQLAVKHRRTATATVTGRNVATTESVEPPNPVTGKPALGPGYAAATIAHSETVLRGFMTSSAIPVRGLFSIPFLWMSRVASIGLTPTTTRWTRGTATGWALPPQSAEPDSAGDSRRTVQHTFAALPSNRDRALVSFWISTGARASELLGARQCDIDPGQQLITVVRKGSRAIQQLPASPDAFVWLRLYQAELPDNLPHQKARPLWWTRRQPLRPLSYHAAHRMFERANAALGSDWTLHDLRHSAAQRMVRDEQLTLTDVQWVLGHAHLTTTERYLTPTTGEVIAGVLAHHAREAGKSDSPPPPAPAMTRRR